MFDTTTHLPGPDFLEAVAEAELHAGNAINHAEYERRARQWREDREALDVAKGELRDLQHRLAAIRQQAAA